MSFLDQVRYRLRLLNGAEKLIAINVVCFVLPFFLNTLFFLFNLSTDSFLTWFELSSSWGELLFKPWTLFSYSFLHSGFFHLFWNMYLLLFASRLFLNLFPIKTFFNVYFLGVLFGGLTFMLSYTFFPVFQNSTPYMIGASAGVMAVLIFMAVYTPDTEVRLLFFNVKLSLIGLALVLLDVIQIPYGNAGGHLAHIGGASLGYIYAQRLKNGVDIGVPFENIVDQLVNFIKKKPTLKTVHKASTNNKKSTSKVTSKQDDHQKRIDSILDKISVSGYDSLSKEEKEFLFRAGKK